MPEEQSTSGESNEEHVPIHKQEDTNKNIPPAETKIATSENITSDIQSMEVHHHPDAEKKGFKEYFFEGLMIFLAVTLGFFAESLREYITERDRSEVFAKSLF